MGINDLWKALTPASHKRTLTQISVSEGFEQRRRPERCLVIGIDASIWMNQAQIIAKLRKGTGCRQGENPAVRVLFYRLCRLLTLPIIPIFVFDGPNRPVVKRGTAVKTARPHWLTLPLQKLAEAFGFSWYTAPGEAEADLAELNWRGEIDAIISEDSDAMVFGARCVIRMQNSKDVGDQVTIFDAHSIQMHPDVSLDRAALFFMVIICGGDYDNNGLNGCGYKTALQVAQTGLARSLFNAVTSSPSEGALSAFLCQWRKSFRTLLAQDPDNMLGRKYPSIANKVTDTFPSLDVLLLYAHPVTSWTINQAPNQSQWRLRQPQLAEIGILCEKYFSWGSSGDLTARCRDTLWPGVVIRFLLAQRNTDSIHDALVRYATNAKEDSSSITSIHIPRIYHAKLGPAASSTNPDVSGFTIAVFAHNIIHENISRLDAATQSLTTKSNCPATISVWVPESILQASVPDVLERFRGKRLAPPPTHPPILSPLLSGALSHLGHVDVHGFTASMHNVDNGGPPREGPSISHTGRAYSDSDVEFIEGPSAPYTSHADCNSITNGDSDVEFVEGPSHVYANHANCNFITDGDSDNLDSDIELPSRIYANHADFNFITDGDSDSDVEFVEGPSHVVRNANIDCGSDIEIVDGPSVSAVGGGNRKAPTFLGFFDLCSPSPSPQPP